MAAPFGCCCMAGKQDPFISSRRTRSPGPSGYLRALGRVPFSSLTAYHPEIGKTAVSPHAHGVLAFGTVPRQCQPSEVHADHFLDGWDACNLERSRRLRTRLAGSPVGDIEWDRWRRSPVPPFKGDHCGCSCSCAAVTSWSWGGRTNDLLGLHV